MKITRTIVTITRAVNFKVGLELPASIHDDGFFVNNGRVGMLIPFSDARVARIEEINNEYE